MKPPKSLVKTVQKKEDFFVEFTDEEMQQLGIAPGDKFEVEIGDANSIVLKKMVSVDINLDEFDKDVLVFLIEESVPRVDWLHAQDRRQFSEQPDAWSDKKNSRPLDGGRVGCRPCQ